jgi:glycosyltransferase involved in cell wall biosynthesis
MEDSSLISIIIPCYNQAHYMNEALQSVFDQTYENWECIIVNDGSFDDTEKIAKKWIAKDTRFNYLYKENGGVSSARNLGIEKAKGDFFQFLDSDDFLDKEKFELSLNQMKIIGNEKVNIVISNFRMFTKKPEKSSKPFCNLNPQLFNFESLLYQWNDEFSIQMQCGFFHSSLFKTIRFPENLTAQEDWIVWVNLFKTGGKAIFIDKPLAFYRINPSSRTMTKGLYEDHMKAYEYFKHFLSDEEFYKLSVVLISRYYKSNDDFKNRLRAAKTSNSYQTGLLIKKVLNTLGVLKPFRYLFPLILKFKSK